MTVTLTTEELANFSNKLSEWYNQRVKFVLERAPTNFTFEVRSPIAVSTSISRSFAEYEKLNPKPDWRSLL